LKRGDPEIRDHAERRRELAAGKRICNAVMFTRDMQDTKVDVVGDQDVHGTAKKVVVGGEAAQGAEDLNSVQIISKNNNAGAAFQALSGVGQGTEDAQGLKVEDGGDMGV
jgi:leucyl aminopeptidase